MTERVKATCKLLEEDRDRLESLLDMSLRVDGDEVSRGSESVARTKPPWRLSCMEASPKLTCCAWCRGRCCRSVRYVLFFISSDCTWRQPRFPLTLLAPIN